MKITDRDILDHYFAEERRRVDARDPDAVNNALSATAKALVVERERVRDVLRDDMRSLG
jgi:hypothetical protein